MDGNESRERAANDAERIVDECEVPPRSVRESFALYVRSHYPLIAFELLFVLLVLFALLLPTRILAAEAGTGLSQIAIPFTIRENLLTIDVEVGGRSYPLMFDLGDYRALSLSSAVLDSVEVDFTGGVDHFTNYAGTAMQARRFRVQSVGIGDNVWQDVNGSEDVYDPEIPSPNPYGAVGSGFFEGALITLDYPNHRILVDDPGHGPPQLRSSGRSRGETDIRLADCVAFDPTGPILVDAEIDGGRHRLLIDTGATHSILDASRFEETELFAGHSAHAAAQLSLGTHSLGPQVFLRLDLGQPDFSGILGYDFLARTSPTLDLSRGCMYLHE